jgi:hypothetical protein
MNTEPYRIMIEAHGCKYTAEMPWDANIEDVTEALRGLLIASGWGAELVMLWLPAGE